MTRRMKLMAALKRGAIAVLAAFSLATPGRAADPRPPLVVAEAGDPAQLQRRFESVGTLLEKSSAARQIEASGVPAATDKHTQAKETYRRAQAAFASGDHAGAAKLLSEASLTMFEAVRAAAPEQVTGQKEEGDFNRRLESVKALLAAQKRISVEKSAQGANERNIRQIEDLLAEAQRLAKAQQLSKARSLLDQAYVMAKSSISSMRTGDTLVRSLNFASKEEEYHYELDRNDTHQMLIKVLVEEKTGGQMDAMMRGFLERAGELRGQGEASAARGDHARAVDLLERSTAELVKAIRNAGIYIPG